MFKCGNKKKIYSDVITALFPVAQVRSSKNKILATTAEGEHTFTSSEDPFFLFRKENPVSEMKQLESAYLQHTLFQIDLKKNHQIWHIHLTPISEDILITATLQQKEYSTPQAIQTQISLFQNIIQNINIPIYLIDISMEIIYINSSFCELLGYSHEQILGQKITTFMDAPDLKMDLVSEATASLNAFNGNPTFTVKQHQIQTPSHPVFFGALYPLLIPHLETSFQNVPFPHVRVVTHTRMILQANDNFTTTFHFSHMPQSLEDVFTKESLNKLFQKLLKIDIQSDGEIQTEVATIQGKVYHVYVSWATPTHDEVDLYFIDITSRKNLEEQLLQNHKMEAIGQLTGGIAHDFNNILTAIMGFTDLLLQRHQIGDDSFPDLMHIKGNVQKAAGLVGQLLTFSRKTPIQEHLISVHDAFVDITSLLQRAIAPHCHLKMEYKRHLGYIKMDINQLTQIFLNFAVNAKDAMPNGGDFIVTLTKEEIKKARPCGNDTIPIGSYVKMVVTDTGTGIPLDILPHIFDPFFTTKKKNEHSGTGLGLSTVYGIIHSAGGFIKVDSVLGVGTTFTVYLPRFEEPPQQISITPTEIQNVFLPTPHAPILLVDDEEAIRTVTSRALQSKGFTVEEASNAEEALKILSHNNAFQLVITDMVMSGMSGEQMIAQINQLYPQIPCLLMSGYSESFEKHTSHTSKTFDFIAKPFVLADLLTKVKEILEKNQKV